MDNDDFWNRLASGHTDTSIPSAVDQHLSPRGFGEAFESVRHLTDRSREASALPLPVPAGTRVSFTGGLGAVLSIDDPPAPGAEGEVVTVRSANGDITHHDGKAFVKWDDGKFRAVYAEHLRLAGQRKAKKATAQGDPTDQFGRVSLEVRQVRVASLGDLTNFLKVSSGSNTLIHRSSNELWSFQKDADGAFLVERLFDGDGQPLKG